MDTLPQTHHEKLVEVAKLLGKMLEEEIYPEYHTLAAVHQTIPYKVWKSVTDHLLYYDSLTNPS